MLKISIIAKDKILYQGEAHHIIVPTMMGIIEILPNHMQLVSVISVGDLIIKHGKGEQSWKVKNGFLEVRPESEVVILTDSIE